MVFRKGVSEVVANVLIILLVIVGVAVIWAVVKPTIQKTSEAVQSDCFTIQLAPVKCEINLEPTSSNFGNVTYTIKRTSGQGDLRQIALSYTGKVIYYSNNLVLTNLNLYVAYLLNQNQALVKENAQDLDELETFSIIKSAINNRDFNFDALANGINLSASTAGIVSTSILTLQSIQPSLNIDLFYLPSTITAHPIIGDEGLICDVGTQPIDCSCTGSLCASVASLSQAEPKCNSLPCTATLS